MFSLSFIVVLTISMVNAQESPKVNPFGPLIKPVIGGRTSFTCQSLSGSPPLQIKWFKDGKELHDSSHTRIRSFEDPSTLVIDSITSSHSGNYTCKMFSRHGEDSFTTQLLVEGPPQWLIKPENIKLSIGEKAVIKCSASSYPKPFTQWKIERDSQWIGIDDINPPDIEIIDNELVIRKASKSHSGSYGCSISNNIEPSLWSQFIVSIDGKNFYK